jgi:hypothetical protein
MGLGELCAWAIELKRKERSFKVYKRLKTCTKKKNIKVDYVFPSRPLYLK